ncbi:btk-binding protein-related [Anaeramoeba flamelloides]|uniref:Btk-binding protein-related n=1 Tax=Anaeramoeba flamelloides TaxID=1746091 RepID=A0AAV7Z4L9_9EUKA|nr:btk-binding protein-related [Anaeramoeba flamelloides]
MQNNTVYGWGYNSSRQYPNKNGNISRPSLCDFLPKDIQLVQIVSTEYRVSYLTVGGEVYETGKSREPKNGKVFQYEVEPIRKLATGFSHLLYLSKTGRLYVTGSQNKPKIGLDTNTINKPKELTYFKDNNIEIVDIAAGNYQNFFVSSEGILYAMGLPIGASTTTFLDQQKLIYKLMDANKTKECGTVERIWGGVHSEFIFIATSKNKLYAYGKNAQGQLGVNNQNQTNTPTIVPDFNADEIKDIGCGNTHSTLLLKDGTLYGCGSAQSSGVGYQTKTFKIIPNLKNKKVIEINSGYAHSLALVEDNNKFDLYSWGTNGDGQLGNGSTTPKNTPEKISIPNFNYCFETKIFCGNCDSLVYNAINNNIQEEFLKILESGEFSDFDISGIKCHKSILKFRTGKQPQVLKTFLEENYEEKSIQAFLNRIYGHHSISSEINKISDQLGISEFPKRKFEEDLRKLFYDEDSKDFSIITTYDEDEEDEEDVEIPVHKFILIVRSGLFREMFQNVTEETNKVKDYSGKSMESLEILIKFLYTQTIELTADDDPQLIAEELEDAIDYYRLDKYCGLEKELKQIKD